MPEPVRIEDIPESHLTPHSERERAVYDLAKVATAPGAVPDELFERAERLLGRNGIAEVLALPGHYSSAAMAVKLHRVPVPA